MYPLAKELPQDDRIPDEADHVLHHQLRAQPPPEKAKVAGMTQKTVDAISDKPVSFLALDLNRMIEIGAGMCHS